MQFGSYDLLGRLATGGSAHIFLAGQRGMRGYERLVCLKTLIPERAKDEEFVNNFVTEAEIASHLNHPNCVNIIDLGLERGSFYISMEYIAGETLASLLSTWTDKAPLPPPDMMSILASVCDGLHYAHELCAPDGHAYQLVHRDVSPQNVMVSYTGQVKVLDFGIAKAEMVREETKTNIVKGKVRYMSPEQILSGPLDRRSDIYSLGLVMFECLTGRMLFENCSPAQIQYKMLHERVPRLKDVKPEIDPQLDAICYTALQFDANARYPTAYVMGRELKAYLKRMNAVGGREAIGLLMRQRFGERAVKRTEFVERVLGNQCDEAEIRITLGARPVLALDLFGEVSTVPASLEQRIETFDEDATIMDPGGMSPVGADKTLDEAEPPPAMSGPQLPPPPPLPKEARSPSVPPALEPITALPLVPDAEEFADQTRLNSDAEVTRPILDPVEIDPRPEDTKKLEREKIERPPTPPEPAPQGLTPRAALLFWLFGLLLGVGLGIVGTLFVLSS